MTTRLIHVGLGNWGQSWYENVVSPYQEVETVAWVEIDPIALAGAQERLDLPPERCFLQIEDALAQVQADAVLITASLPGHVPGALAALRANKHVLLEKPFAPTMAEAAMLVELAEERECILMVSQNYRFAPAVQKVRQLVREGQLGAVSSVEIDFRKFSNTAPVETNRHYHIWHPLLVDMAIHHFDLMRAVLGQEPRQVMCQTWNPSWSHFVQPPAAALTIQFDGGAVVSYRGSWISQGPATNWGGEWRMDCAEGQIIWTSRGEIPDAIDLCPAGQPLSPVTLPTVKLRDRSGSLDAFIQACQNGETPECTGRDNLKTLALVLAAVESADTGLAVNVPEIL